MVTFFMFDDFDYSQSILINRILLILIFFTYCVYADRVRKQKLQQIYTSTSIDLLGTLTISLKHTLKNTFYNLLDLWQQLT